MPLFGKKTESVIGVDIGSSSIKMIELAHRDGRAHLVTYGFADPLSRDARGSAKEDIEYLASAIKSIQEKTRFSTKMAVAALPTYSVFTSLISLPFMNKEELQSAVHWEAKKIIPLPLEEIVLDFKILNEPKKGEKNPEYLKILLIGAARDTVKRYTEIFAQSGLILTSLETEMFALTRALVGDDPSEVMIVEMGATTTDIILVENGVPFLTRTVEVGGAALTRAITTSLNIDEKRADRYKKDIGIIVDATQQQGVVPQILETALEPLLHEIKYTFGLYKDLTIKPSDTATGVVEKVILTGGTALLPNIDRYLSKALDTRVILGDPWSRAVYPEDLRSELMKIGPRFSVAIGLALRTSEN